MFTGAESGTQVSTTHITVIITKLLGILSYNPLSTSCWSCSSLYRILKWGKEQEPKNDFLA